MQIITYKRKLKLTKQQQHRVDSWIGTCRFVYNLALETRITAWKKQKNIGKYELMKQLTDLKDIEWIADVPSQSLQNVIERLDSDRRCGSLSEILFRWCGVPPRLSKVGKQVSL